MAFRSRTAQTTHRLSMVWAFVLSAISFGCVHAEKIPNQTTCTISGGINNGIQIQNCPVIEQAPTPSFRILQEYPIVKNDDGTFKRSAVIVIEAPYVPNNMLVSAVGATVRDINVTNTLVVGGGKNLDPNIHNFAVSEPSGKYTIDIITSDDVAPVSLVVKFNQDINFK